LVTRIRSPALEISMASWIFVAAAGQFVYGDVAEGFLRLT